MNQTTPFVQTLKKCLKSRGLTYQDLTEPLGLSEASVKRLFAEENFALERLTTICSVLDMSLAEVAALAEGRVDAEARTLSVEQEEALALDERLFAILYLLLHDWSVKDVAADFGLSERQMRSYLSTLDRLKIIELHPKDRIRLKVSRHLSWRPDGPIRRQYEAKVTSEFLSSKFSGSDELFRFTTGELSESSMRLVTMRLKAFIREVNELVAIDANLDKRDTTSVGLLVAFRPWLFSMITEIRNKAKPSK